MALDPDIKKILCDRKVAALAASCADLVETGMGTGKPTFTDDQLERMIALDEQWIEETEAVIEDG